MSSSPIEVVGYCLQNLLDPEVVNNVVAADATYVTLNTDDTERNKIMPWAGASHDATAASFRQSGSWIVQTEPDTEAFEV